MSIVSSKSVKYTREIYPSKYEGNTSLRSAQKEAKLAAMDFISFSLYPKEIIKQIDECTSAVQVSNLMRTAARKYL